MHFPACCDTSIKYFRNFMKREFHRNIRVPKIYKMYRKFILTQFSLKINKIDRIHYPRFCREIPSAERTRIRVLRNAKKTRLPSSESRIFFQIILLCKKFVKDSLYRLLHRARGKRVGKIAHFQKLEIAFTAARLA